MISQIENKDQFRKQEDKLKILENEQMTLKLNNKDFHQQEAQIEKLQTQQQLHQKSIEEIATNQKDREEDGLQIKKLT